MCLIRQAGGTQLRHDGHIQGRRHGQIIQSRRFRILLQLGQSTGQFGE